MKNSSSNGIHMDPICPYCGKMQMMWPKQRKKKCSFCKNMMHIRYQTAIEVTGGFQMDNEILVTETEAWLYDQFYFFAAYSGKKRNDFIKWKEETEFISETSYKDKVWGLLNKLLIDFMKESDFKSTAEIYYQMAKFLKEDGKDAYAHLQQYGRMRLLEIKKYGNAGKKVVIGIAKTKIDPVPCEICLALEGREYIIDEALAQLPIPPKECYNKYCFTYYEERFSYRPI